VANRYWVGGAGASWRVTSSWSTTAGGASGASVPGTADDVFFTSTASPLIDGTSNCRNLTCSASVSISNSTTAVLNVYGSVATNNNSFTLTFASGNGFVLNGSSGTQTIDFGTNHTINANIRSAGNSAKSVSRSFTIDPSKSLVINSGGAFSLNDYTITCGIFDCSSSSSKTVNFGTSGSIICNRNSSGASVLCDGTGVTLTGSRTVIVEPGGNAITITGHGSATESVHPNITLRNGSGGITFTTSTYIGNLTVNSSYTGTIANTNWLMTGNLDFQSNDASFASGTLEIEFRGTASTTLTLPAGKILPAVEVNKTAGGLTLNQATTVTNTLTLNGGNLNLNNNTLTVSIFNSSTTASRSISFGSTGAIYVTASGGGVINIGSTGASFSGSKNVYFTGSGSTTMSATVGSYGAGSLNVIVNTTGGIFDLTGDVVNLTTSGAGSFRPGAAVVNVYGNFYFNSAATSSGNALVFRGSSGETNTIETLTNIDFPLTFDTSGKTWTVLSDITVAIPTSGATKALTFNAGTLDMTNRIVTMGRFNSSSGNTREIIFGSSGEIVLKQYSTSTDIYNVTNSSNFSYTGSGLFRCFAPGNETFLITTTGHTINNAPNFILEMPTATSAASATIDFTNGSVINDLSIVGGVLTVGLSTITIYGNYSVTSAVVFTASSTATWTFAKPSGTQTVSGSPAHNILLVKSGDGTLQLLSNFGQGTGIATLRTFTLSSGVIDLNNYVLNVSSFVSSNSNTRSLNFGTSGVLNIVNEPGTGVTNTVFNMGDPTNFTSSGTSEVRISGAGASTGVRSISIGTASEAAALTFNVVVSVASAQVNFNSSYINGLTINTNAATVFTAASITLYGNYTYSSGTVQTGTNTWTFAKGSGTQTINTNGLTHNLNFTKSGAGTAQLAANLTLGASKTLTVTEGTFDANGYDVSLPDFNSSGSTARTLILGSGTWTIANNWECTIGTNLSVTPGTSTILMTSASAKSFNGGGGSYGTVRQAGTGALTIRQNNSFGNLTNITTNAVTVTFESGSTQTFALFGLSGSAGNICTINSTTPGVRFSLAKNSGTVNVSYMSIQDSAATGGAAWYSLLTNNNIDAGNNAGWYFLEPPVTNSSQFMFMFM